MNKRKVLLAEDDPDDQTIFQDFLSNRKDIVLLAPVENGESLMQMLASNPEPVQLPDIIILDQNMPRKNGLQTLQELKDDRRFAHIPVVIYSTYTDHLLTKAAIESGAYKVATKPVTRYGYNQMMDEFMEFFRPA